MSKRDLLCVYCGKNRHGDDHVPPKNLFLKPRPTLIKVAACKDCNEGASLDDEYFRFVLITRRDLDGNPVVKQLRAEVFSGLDRPESAGFRQEFIDSTRMGPNGPQAQTNFDRLNRVAARTVRGLHFYTYGKTPPAANVDAYCDDAFDPDGIQATLPLSKILKSLREEPPKVIHDDVFEYRFTTIEGRPDSSAWLMTFFNRAWIMALVNCK